MKVTIRWESCTGKVKAGNMMGMSAQNISDYEIQALVDNELDWEKEKRVRAFVDNNARAQERYQELIEQKEILREWWRGHH